jgi:hypothetical protein
LIIFVKESTGNTRILRELYLYTTIHRSLTQQHPYLNLLRPIHLPRTNTSGNPLLQPPHHIYPPSAPYYLSNSSPHIPVSGFKGIGYDLRPVIRTPKFVAGADWKPKRGWWSELARLKGGISDLEQKKAVWLWKRVRTEKVVQEERRAGWRRSGDGFVPKKKNDVEKAVLREDKWREEWKRVEREKQVKARPPPGTKPEKPRRRKMALRR